jgi:ABC-type bacteriocin/lantibiotic exporter with double-glycine peptidase domain
MVIVQQSLVAFSTVSIIFLMSAITQHKAYLAWLSLFCLSLIAPMVPGFLSIIAITKSSLLSFGNYIKLFVEGDHNITPGNHSELESIFSSSAETIISEFSETLRHSLALVANFILNVMVISFLINSELIIGYLLGSAAAIFFTMKMSKKVSLRTQLALENKVKMDNFLISGPDNIFIGSEINKKSWETGFLRLFRTHLDYSLRSEKINQSVPVISSYIASIPIFFFIILIIYKHRYDLSYLAVVVSTLPRQVLMIQGVYSIVSVITMFLHSKTKITILWDKMGGSENINNANIDVKITNINGEEFHVSGYDDVLNITNNFCPGRFTLTGRNGSGKSTLLLLIKRIKTSAHYLPTSSRLLFSLDSENSYCGLFSTGERTRLILDEMEKTTGDIYLLDEWDANLDENNRKYCSDLIDSISLRACVIEVRHRCSGLQSKAESSQSMTACSN